MTTTYDRCCVFHLCAEVPGILEVELMQRLNVVTGECYGHQEDVSSATFHQTLDALICVCPKPRLRPDLKQRKHSITLSTNRFPVTYLVTTYHSTTTTIWCINSIWMEGEVVEAIGRHCHVICVNELLRHSSRVMQNHHHQCAVVVSHGWAKVSASFFRICLSSTILYQDGALPVLIYFVSPPSGLKKNHDLF